METNIKGTARGKDMEAAGSLPSTTIGWKEYDPQVDQGADRPKHPVAHKAKGLAYSIMSLWISLTSDLEMSKSLAMAFIIFSSSSWYSPSDTATIKAAL